MKFSILTLIAMMVLLATGCTKPRDTQVADEELDAELVAITDLQGEGFSLQLAGSVQAKASTKLAIEGKKLPPKIAPLLEGETVMGKPGTLVTIRFEAAAKNLFLHRVITGSESLTPLEQDLVRIEDGKKVLPLFAIPIKAAGILVPIKNDLGEATHKLTLRDTDLSVATHLRLDLRPESLTAIQMPKNQPELQKEIIAAESLRDKVHTRAELETLIPTELNLGDNQYAVMTSEDDDLAKTQVKVLIYSIHKKSTLKDARLLAQLNGSNSRLDIRMCGSTIAGQTQPSLETADCVLILERSLLAFQIKAEMASDAQGQMTDTVVLKPVAQKNQGRLLQIGAGSVVRLENTSDQLTLSQQNLIAIDFLKGKEFLLRRTFEDAASTLMAFGPGASGGVDIVRFQFEPDRVVVKRVGAVNGAKNPGELDQEELMSFPAQYLQTRNSQGLVLAQPRRTTPEKADAISMDWLQNTIPVANSPLSFLSAGQCFLSVGHQSIQGLDQRLTEGVLNFSIQGSYTFRPECMSTFGLHDYWYENNAQATYNLSERVSFRLHDPAQDQVQTQDLPFRAQQLLGFGVFTAGERDFDKFGNSSQLTEEKAHPVIQDFRNGRTVTYVLGGATPGTTAGDLVIRAAKQVIADWNESLHKAFQGTDLDRAGDYLTLQIEGVDIAKGHLGDLDRNYIFNFEKNMDSGLLGLSQAAPNPRTGFVESANVLMYGGNLLAYIGYEKEVARIQKDYETLKKSILAQASATAQSSTSSSSHTGKSTSASASQGSGTGNLETDTFSLDEVINAGGLRRPMTPAMQSRSETMLAMGSAQARSQYSLIRKTSVDTSGMKSQALGQFLSRRDYVQRIMQKAIDAGEMHNGEWMEALSAAEILKAYGSDLSTEERRLLSLQSQKLALKAEFAKNFRQGPNCFMSTPESMKGLDFSKASVDEIFVNWYSDTLSHELGHSLGLTHNFKGSYDKANFEFPSEKSGREYSSIMDYKPASHTDYRKPGPYDVHALRAAYTGLIEVAEAVKKAAKSENGSKVLVIKTPENQSVKITLPQGQFVRLEDLKTILVPERSKSDGTRVKSFWDLNAQMLARFPLLAHGFCTDIDVGGDPTCQRWDAGTTPQEVAAFHIDEYRAMYPVLNARNARINGVGFGSYFSRIMMSEYTLRSFLDEAMFRLVQGAPQQEWIPFALAAWSGMNQLLETVATPTANLAVFDENRFSVQEIEVEDKDGKKSKKNILTERKALKDLRVPGLETAVETRGIEIDKILALQFLTLQSLGNPRYEQASLRFSFVDFERLLLGQAEDQSLVVKILEGAIAGQVPGITFVGQSPVALEGSLNVEVSEAMRYYSVLGSTVLLDNSSTVDSANPARLFLVGSTLKEGPADRPIVTRLGSKLSSPTALKLFAHDPASSVNRLVRKAARDRVIIDHSEALAKQFSTLIDAKEETAKVAARKAMVETLATLNTDSLLASGNEDEKGSNLTQQVAVMEKYFAARKALTGQIEELIGKGATLAQLKEQTNEIQTSDENLTKDIPVLAVAQKVLSAGLTSDLQKEIAAAVIPSNVLEGEHSTIVGSLEQMNRLISLMNPELNR